MSSVLDYAWRDFAPVVVTDPTFDDLRVLARQKDPGFFVLHEERTLTSAFVLPGLISHLLRQVDLSPGFAATEAGLVDLLASGQVRVHANLPARAAARVVTAPRAWAGVVVDDKFKPVGVFLPSTLAERIPRASMLAEHLRVAFEQTLGKQGFAAALDLVESQISAFHSEGINYAAPDPLVCRGDPDDGPHSVHACPCARHPGASCGRSSAAPR